MHWKTYRQQSTGQVKRSISYLFDSTGTFGAYIQVNATGSFDGYIGRPGSYMGTFSSLAEAKRAIETEIKLRS